MQPFRQRIESMAARCIPACLTVLILLFSSVLGRIQGVGQVMPWFNIISIYYWCVLYPGALPYSFLFLLGILQDSLAGTPLGFSSFLNLVLAWVINRKFHIMVHESFSTLWLRFIIVSFAGVLLGWFTMSVYYSGFLPFKPALLQWGSTCFAYPVFHLLFTRLYHNIRD